VAGVAFRTEKLLQGGPVQDDSHAGESCDLDGLRHASLQDLWPMTRPVVACVRSCELHVLAAVNGIAVGT